MSDAPTPDRSSNRVLPTVNTPAPERRLGQFVLRELLGEGGMGEVYRAEDTLLGRDVAIKLMRPEMACRADARERFLREARAASKVRHDHIVEIHQVGEDGGTPYIVMPLLAGESLERRLRREPCLPASEVLRIGREAAEGLAAAHAAGLIHRDVKPANLWLEAPAGRVKLLDFGLARITQADGQTQAGVVLGSPGFMSPEQIDGQPVDHRTDLFSLGCVLYRLATGKPAFPGKTLTAILRATAEKEPAPAQAVQPTLPGPLSGLIMGLLAKCPADRPPTARDVVACLDEIERLGDVRTTDYQPRPPAERSRRWAFVSVSVLVVFAAAAGLLRRPWQPPVAEAGHKEPLATTFDVRVWKKADTTRGLPLEAAVPLAPGDYLRVEATANRPAYFYLIYLDVKGEASPWFPWRGWSWQDRPKETARQSLSLPEREGQGEWKLTDGPAGIESLLLLARDEPLTPDENGRLARVLSGKPQQGKFDPLRGVVWLGTSGDQFSQGIDRGRPEADKEARVLDPVERVRRLLRTEVADLAEARRGVCYPFAGK